MCNRVQYVDVSTHSVEIVCSFVLNKNSGPNVTSVPFSKHLAAWHVQKTVFQGFILRLIYAALMLSDSYSHILPCVLYITIHHNKTKMYMKPCEGLQLLNEVQNIDHQQVSKFAATKRLIFGENMFRQPLLLWLRASGLPSARTDIFTLMKGPAALNMKHWKWNMSCGGGLTCSHQSDVWGRLIRGKGDPRGNGRRLGEVEGRGERLWNDLWTASFCCFITVQMKKCRILGEKSSNDKITDQWFRRRKANNTFKMRSNADGLECVQWKELSPMHILIQYLYSRWLKSR